LSTPPLLSAAPVRPLMDLSHLFPTALTIISLHSLIVSPSCLPARAPPHKHHSLMSIVPLSLCYKIDRLCGLLVRVSGYRSIGPGFDSRRFQIS
jgi:hypothetical protein